MLNKTIINKLFELADEDYRKFQSKLCPGTDNIIGVRVPKIRKLAQEIVKENPRKFLDETIDKENIYYEENMLQGLVIALSKDIEICDIMNYLDKFVPKIDNWAVCDIVCSSMKKTSKHKKEMWNYLEKFILSKREFELRFAIVMYIDYYLIDEYIDEVLKRIDKIDSNQYYVNMATAWLISVAYVKYPRKTIEFLNNSNISDKTYNMALQKIIESNKVNKEEKERFRNMKK